MSDQTNVAAPAGSKLVSAEKLLELIFDPDSRPSLRWLRDQQERRTIPFCRIGRLIFFDPDQVKAHLAEKAARQTAPRKKPVLA